MPEPSPRVYDITRPVSQTLACWPGDTPYAFEWSARISEGSSVNVGALHGSTHTGSHADAPLHFEEGAESIDVLELDPFLGEAVLLDVAGRIEILPTDLSELREAPSARVLLRTGGWSNGSRFPDSIPVLHPSSIEFLASLGVRLLGLDVPSVDALDSRDLPNHHALGRFGIRILESLDLTGVPAGRYELIALPLKLVGADASPVRAVLREWSVEE